MEKSKTKIDINPRTEELKNELGSLIWKMATNLVHGGKVNPVQFMDYTLGCLFYRFISENITDWANTEMHEAGDTDDYPRISDEKAEIGRGAMIRFVPRESSFRLPGSSSTWRTLRGGIPN